MEVHHTSVVSTSLSTIRRDINISITVPVMPRLALGRYPETRGAGVRVSYGGVMPLYAIVVREYFGAQIMGSTFGAACFASTLGMALGPLAGGWLYDAFGSYAWLFIGSSGVGLGAVAIACTFRPPRELLATLPIPRAAH
jgi:MFS family permease